MSPTAPLDQLDLWTAAQARQGFVTLEQRFKLFHAANPAVYEKLEARAMAQVRAGVRHGSIAMLYEVIRYDASVETGGAGEMFKLNNDFKPFYARLIMKKNPSLRASGDKPAFFKTRKSEADND